MLHLGQINFQGGITGAFGDPGTLKSGVVCGVDFRPYLKDNTVFGAAVRKLG